MKIVALLTARDEAPFLPFYLDSISAVADEVVGLDDGSSDETPALLHRAGVRMVSACSDVTSFSERRQLLLDEGRRLLGTHFVCLDADEVFLGRAPSIRAAIGQLRPGEVMALKQVNFWRGVAAYRDDWAYRRPLGCIVADDGERAYDRAVIHEDRVPEPRGTPRVAVDPSRMAVGHLQFVAWDRAQAKQAWYRCLERLEGTPSIRINARYWFTLDRRDAVVRPVNADWLQQVAPAGQELSGAPVSWHRQAALDWFQAHGPACFESLQVWSDPALLDRFKAEMGRPPSPQPDWLVRLAVHAGILRDVAKAGARRALRASGSRRSA